MEVLGNGLIQYVSPKIAIASNGNKLFKSYNSGRQWKYWCSIPVSKVSLFFSSNRWLSRLTRQEIHHVLWIKENIYACFAFGYIFLIKEDSDQLKCIGKIRGSRPLKICSDGERIFYGEYKNNKQRQPVNLFFFDMNEKRWFVYYTFDDIRHIHGVFWDKYTSRLWLTTGDLDEESSLICFTKERIPQKVATASQQTRTVDLLFSEDSIFYATDAPHDTNYIYKFDRATGETTKKQKIGGPVFWGRKEKNNMFFSTVVEPTEVNRLDAVELWGSFNGGSSWKLLDELAKDFGNLRLFQYGQIKFPYGPGDRRYLWLSPYATEYDHKIIQISLE